MPFVTYGGASMNNAIDMRQFKAANIHLE